MTSQNNTFNDSKDNRYLLDQIIRFTRQLHDSGINVNLTNLIDLFDGIKYIDIANPDDFYATSCATLISSHHDLALFDHLFNSFWYPDKTEDKILKQFTDNDSDDSGTLEKENRKEITQQEQKSQNKKPDKTQANSQTAYSPNEYLMKKDLGLMSPDEMEQARSLIEELITIIANIQNRRRKKNNKGHELFFREMLRRNASHGSDGMEILFRKKRIKKTRLILLCDVSGSMERYSRFLIHIIYAMYQELKQLEVAVFSTHMNVITDCLNTDKIDDSLDNITRTVHDWAGGTNIGQCIQEFNQYLSQEMSSSNTIIVILSDGWDRGDASKMADEMKHLHNYAHKILWLNPLMGHDEYQPLCQGMQTALPYIDYFMPAHNLESFARLIKQIRLLWQ
ncbi:MAG: VWA domain-containing protein [Proteobacteria bacterium]|nr:VWA domain-containing protein [Pseudomonadota bacterium]NOG59592.1 VWA domain-containing protein [Pseudomonadota bacterium]